MLNLRLLSTPLQKDKPIGSLSHGALEICTLACNDLSSEKAEPTQPTTGFPSISVTAHIPKSRKKPNMTEMEITTFQTEVTALFSVIIRVFEIQ